MNLAAIHLKRKNIQHDIKLTLFLWETIKKSLLPLPVIGKVSFPNLQTRKCSEDASVGPANFDELITVQLVMKVTLGTPNNFVFVGSLFSVNKRKKILELN